MRLARKLIAMLLVVLWVPLTSHCILEDVGVFPMNAGCAEEASHSGHGHKKNAECCPLESASYFVQKHADFKHLLILKSVPFAVLALFDVPAKEHSEVPTEILVPPGFFRTWQWYQSTALPVRAPSAAS